MASRAVSVCLVVLLVCSLFAVGSVPAGADDGDDWWVSLVHDHDEDDDEEDDHEEDDRDDDDDYEEDEEYESDDEDDDEDDGDDWDDWDDEDNEDEDDEWVFDDSELDCNESDHDRGHGNDCDGDDEDNPGHGPGGPGDDDDEGLDLPDPTPTPTASPTPTAAPASTATPTTEPTPTSSPPPQTPSPEDETDATDGSGPIVGSQPTEESTPVVRDSDHEIGGFEAVRSVTTNRSTVAAGEWVEIAVTVENVNDEPRSVVVDLTVFGEVVAVEEVTVPPETTEQVRFAQKFDAPGTYRPSVGDVETTVRVEEQSETPDDRTVEAPGQFGFGVVAALVAVVVAALAIRRA